MVDVEIARDLSKKEEEDEDIVTPWDVLGEREKFTEI
jgi:hypothetical protein